MVVIEMKNGDYLFAQGHTACAGCGMAITVRHVLEAAGEDTIVVNATGCLEIVSSAYPKSAWEVPYIHCLFENAASVATGVVHSLRAQGNDHTKVIVLGGDGSSYDIGFGALSGMLERNEDVLYICYDNEAYMNTGNQRSGATPFGAWTTTSPVGEAHKGKEQWKKPLIDIVAAHDIPYAATSSIAYPMDVQAKVKKALSKKGSKVLIVYAPCVPGWGIASDKTIEVARLVVETGLWKMLEIEHGKRKVTMKPSQFKPVSEYIATQRRRFKHLTPEMTEHIQKLVDKSWEKEEKLAECFKE